MGRLKLNIKTTSRKTHFTWNERLKLQYFYCGSNGYTKIKSPTVLANILCKSERTIRREIKRGLVEHKTTYLETIIEYNAEHAQLDAEFKASAKGPQLKSGTDWALMNSIGNLIKDSHYSPYAVIQYFNHNGWPSSTRICEKTIYNYVEKGYIPNLTTRDLLRKGVIHRHKSKPRKHSRLANAERTIENRKDKINKRKEFGHWEGDTVYSCKNKSKAGLFTLTERKTRTEIVIKIHNRKAQTIVKALDTLERTLGAKKFRFMFKSITFDNGSEFSAIKDIEKSISTKINRTNIYFAHPYCSSERGTNENHNGIIRRFCPKGTDFSLITKKSLKDIQNWMNNYPRKILDGNTPINALQNEINDFHSIPSFLEVS